MQAAAPDVFETNKTRKAKDQGPDVKGLHAKIGGSDCGSEEDDG